MKIKLLHAIVPRCSLHNFTYRAEEVLEELRSGQKILNNQTSSSKDGFLFPFMITLRRYQVKANISVLQFKMASYKTPDFSKVLMDFTSARNQ